MAKNPNARSKKIKKREPKGEEILKPNPKKSEDSENDKDSVESIKSIESIESVESVESIKSEDSNDSNNKLWQILTLIGTVILGCLFLFLPNSFLKNEKTDIELAKVGQVDSNSQTKGANLEQTHTSNNSKKSRLIADFKAPAFEEKWSRKDNVVIRKTKAPSTFEPITLNEQGAKLQFLPYIKTSSLIIETARATPLKTNEGELLNTKDIYFSNSLNDPRLRPSVKPLEDGRINVIINEAPPPTKNTSRVDKIFVVTPNMVGRHLTLTLLAKAENLNRKENTEQIKKERKKPRVLLRTISERGANNWLKMSRVLPTEANNPEIPGGWVKIEGDLNINPSIKLLHLRAQTGENYRLELIPEIKATSKSIKPIAPSLKSSPTPKPTSTNNVSNPNTTQTNQIPKTQGQ